MKIAVIFQIFSIFDSSFLEFFKIGEFLGAFKAIFELKSNKEHKKSPPSTCYMHFP